MEQLANDWLNEHGDYLYRFALARLRDPHHAEDAVQETFLAAVKNNNFGGESSVRTWLTGILKHKIIDSQRKQIREQPVSDLINLDDSEQSMDDFFDATGHWLEKPVAFGMPDNTLQQQQFLSVLDDCMRKLPKKLANIFLLRDVYETDNEEICKELSVTATNAWVMLYRARMRLRKCLEINWVVE